MAAPTSHPTIRTGSQTAVTLHFSNTDNAQPLNDEDLASQSDTQEEMDPDPKCEKDLIQMTDRLKLRSRLGPYWCQRDIWSAASRLDFAKLSTDSVWPLNSIRYLNKLKDQRRDEKTLKRLTSTSLPIEMVMEILRYSVMMTLYDLHLNSHETLLAATASLLGLSASAKFLWSMSTRAILETACVRLDIGFERQEGAPYPTSRIPPFVLHLDHSIRHLELQCKIEMKSFPTYPIKVLQLTKGITPIQPYFPLLRTLTLVLFIHISRLETTVLNFRLGALVDHQCRLGYNQITTLRTVVCLLLGATRESDVGKRKFFHIRCEDRNSEARAGREVELGKAQDVEEMLSEACEWEKGGSGE